MHPCLQSPALEGGMHFLSFPYSEPRTDPEYLYNAEVHSSPRGTTMLTPDRLESDSLEDRYPDDPTTVRWAVSLGTRMIASDQGDNTGYVKRTKLYRKRKAYFGFQGRSDESPHKTYTLDTLIIKKSCAASYRSSKVRYVSSVTSSRHFNQTSAFCLGSHDTSETGILC